VPNTGGLKGIKTAAAAGIVAGKAEKKLEVIVHVDASQKEVIKVFLEKTPMAKTDKIFDITVTVFAGASSAKVRITDFHTSHTEVDTILRERGISRIR
jgi:L-cysteine desulfidase